MGNFEIKQLFEVEDADQAKLQGEWLSFLNGQVGAKHGLSLGSLLKIAAVNKQNNSLRLNWQTPRIRGGCE